MIERSPHRERFTRIDNHAIESRALSMQALGLLAYLLSRPDDWNPERVQLAGQFTNGRDAVAAALRELEAAGHLTRRRERGEAGRWEWKRVVHELPVPAEQHTSVQEPHSGATSDDAVKPQVAASDGIPVSGSIDGKSVSGATSGNNAKPQVGSIDGISVDGKSVDVVTTEGATTETTTERRLCDLLADEIARNTGRRPTVGKR